MTKTSIILLIGIAVMILIGAEVWWATGGDTNSLPTNNPIATPIAASSTQTSTIIAPASSSR